MRERSVDAGGMTSAWVFSCSARCGPRRRDWLGSDAALSKSAGYTAGWTRGSELARSSKVSWIQLPAICMDALVQCPPRCTPRDKFLHLHLQLRINTSHEGRNQGCFGTPVYYQCRGSCAGRSQEFVENASAYVHTSTEGFKTLALISS
jgi:hypothetical protein